tara:strand:- start:304 stop:825 length:522 start_codon:yes stop_codon:yes gene_type:complete
MNLIELQNKIHAQNKDMGWWDEPRQFSTFVCLFHSELSEAMEGDRKGLMDDHLPEYEMFWVELADFVIRCMDWLGSNDHNGLNDNFLIIKEDTSPIKLIADMHWNISSSYESDQNGDHSERDAWITDAVHTCFGFAKAKKFGIYSIILEKVEYNKHRADHKRENRAKTGGKKY